MVRHVEAQLAEDSGLIQLGVVTSEEPALGRRERIARERLLVGIEVFERWRVLVATYEAVERGLARLLAVEGADDPRPAAVRIVPRRQARLERGDVRLFVIRGEAARVAAEIVDRRIV